MSMDHAKQFLEKMMNDETLHKKVSIEEPKRVAAIAAELGYEFTSEELERALKELRNTTGQTPEKLSSEEMNLITGSGIWDGEDAPDGHEMGRFISYHRRDWSYENDIYCKQMYWCVRNHWGGAAF